MPDAWSSSGLYGAHLVTESAGNMAVAYGNSVDRTTGICEMTPDEIVKILLKHDLWLRSKPGGEPADLSYAELEGIDLSRANLVRAKLVGARLTKCDLSRTDLSKADLYGAALEYSNLTGANLSGADMRGAKLRGAGLFRRHRWGHAGTCWIEAMRSPIR